MLDILRRVCRISLVQHDMSMMRPKLLAGIAALVLSASAAHAAERATHACELEAKILKNNSLHALIKCDGIEVLHEDMRFYYPRGGPHDAAHECKLQSIEQIDKAGIILHDYCEYRIGGKKLWIKYPSS
jgi:hypothetical protein